MPTFRLPWTCPECGCGTLSCADYGVTCQCCGNASFVFESNADVKFYAGQLSCPVCGKRWLGTTGTDPACASPVFSVNTLHYFGGVLHYRYLHTSDGLYHLADNSALPFILGTGDVYDSCGRKVDPS